MFASIFLKSETLLEAYLQQDGTYYYSEDNTPPSEEQMQDLTVVNYSVTTSEVSYSDGGVRKINFMDQIIGSEILQSMGLNYVDASHLIINTIFPDDKGINQNLNFSYNIDGDLRVYSSSTYFPLKYVVKNEDNDDLPEVELSSRYYIFSHTSDYLDSLDLDPSRYYAVEGDYSSYMETDIIPESDYLILEKKVNAPVETFDLIFVFDNLETIQNLADRTGLQFPLPDYAVDDFNTNLESWQTVFHKDVWADKALGSITYSDGNPICLSIYRFKNCDYRNDLLPTTE